MAGYAPAPDVYCCVRSESELRKRLVLGIYLLRILSEQWSLVGFFINPVTYTHNYWHRLVLIASMETPIGNDT